MTSSEGRSHQWSIRQWHQASMKFCSILKAYLPGFISAPSLLPRFLPASPDWSSGSRQKNWTILYGREFLTTSVLRQAVWKFIFSDVMSGILLKYILRSIIPSGKKVKLTFYCRTKAVLLPEQLSQHTVVTLVSEVHSVFQIHWLLGTSLGSFLISVILYYLYTFSELIFLFL